MFGLIKPDFLENIELIQIIRFLLADIENAKFGGKYNISGPVVMLKKLKTIFHYFILILLGAALIACGKYVHSKKSARPQENHAQKLAALKADLSKAGSSGSRKRYTSRNTTRTTTRRTTKSGST